MLHACCDPELALPTQDNSAQQTRSANAGTTSQTIDQHCTSIWLASRVSWVAYVTQFMRWLSVFLMLDHRLRCRPAFTEY